MDLNKLKEKLEKLQTRSGSDTGEPSEFYKLKWKPTAGTTDIRLLPYKHTEDGSFLMVGLHYNTFGNRDPYLSPGFFGKPDPIFEFCQKLRNIQGRSKDEWWADIQVVNKLEYSKRFIAPILVRGLESEGVKFWEFGAKVFNKIAALTENPDYGDIEDMETGTDLTVTYTPNKEDVRKSETEITPRRNSSKATTDPVVLNAIEEMPNVLKMIHEPTYDEFKQMLADFIGSNASVPATDKDAVPPVTAPASKSSDVTDVEAGFQKILDGK